MADKPRIFLGVNIFVDISEKLKSRNDLDARQKIHAKENVAGVT